MIDTRVDIGSGMLWTYSGGPPERIGHERGEWFERYVEAIFKFAGFVTERDRIFSPSVKHEIDVWAEAEFGAVAVECKDWQEMPIAELKKELDAFATKVRQTGATTGVFAITLPDDGRFRRYREYMRSEHLTFWDRQDIERWYERIDRYRDKKGYQKALCDSLGIQIRPKTGAEKAFGVLKKAGLLSVEVGGLSVKAAMVGAKVVDDLSAPPKKNRKRHESPH